MSRTYRRAKSWQWDDGDCSASPLTPKRKRSNQTPRYQPGSRRKPRNISAVGVHRDPPDLDKLMRAIAQAALERTNRKPEDTDATNRSDDDEVRDD